MPQETTAKPSYKPLIVIFSVLSLSVALLSWRDASVGDWMLDRSMSQFMAGFFLIFAGAKLLDIHGFADGFSRYDLLASRMRAYGFVYPFIELTLGFAYLHGTLPDWVHIVTATLMIFGSLGVILRMVKGEKFACACLGSLLNVPVSAVTLVEDLGMAAMALIMLAR